MNTSFYQLKSSWFESNFRSCFHWSSTYFLMTSRSIQTVETKYHRLQKLFWEICFFFAWVLWRMMADLPLSLQTVCATEYLGAILIMTWMWSHQTLPLMISTSYCLASFFRMSAMSCRMPWKSTFFLYFGTITIWYVQSHWVWASCS